MSKRHYELLARVLHEQRCACRPSTEIVVTDNTIRALAQALAADNPRFDTLRFCRAAMAGSNR